MAKLQLKADQLTLKYDFKMKAMHQGNWWHYKEKLQIEIEEVVYFDVVLHTLYPMSDADHVDVVFYFWSETLQTAYNFTKGAQVLSF